MQNFDPLRIMADLEKACERIQALETIIAEFAPLVPVLKAQYDHLLAGSGATVESGTTIDGSKVGTYENKPPADQSGVSRFPDEAGEAGKPDAGNVQE